MACDVYAQRPAAHSKHRPLFLDLKLAPPAAPPPTHRMQHHTDEALAGFEAAFLMSPTNVTIKVLLGCIYVARKRWGWAAGKRQEVGRGKGQTYRGARGRRTGSIVPYLSQDAAALRCICARRG